MTSQLDYKLILNFKLNFTILTKLCETFEHLGRGAFHRSINGSDWYIA